MLRAEDHAAFGEGLVGHVNYDLSADSMTPKHWNIKLGEHAS